MIAHGGLLLDVVRSSQHVDLAHSTAIASEQRILIDLFVGLQLRIGGTGVITRVEKFGIRVKDHLYGSGVRVQGAGKGAERGHRASGGAVS